MTFLEEISHQLQTHGPFDAQAADVLVRQLVAYVASQEAPGIKGRLILAEALLQSVVEAHRTNHTLPEDWYVGAEAFLKDRP
jgi:hypothetical protein